MGRRGESATLIDASEPAESPAASPVRRVPDRALALLASPSLPVLLTLFGVALRTRRFLAGFSFEVAEAMLGLNLRGRSYAALLLPLDNEQGAPFGFLWISRFALVHLGEGEQVLRAFPWLCSVVACGLFLALARRALPRLAVPWACLLFAISPDLVLYGSTFKAYSVDVALSLGVLLLAWPALEAPLSRRRLVGLALLGALAPFFSHASVLVLAGVGLTLAGVAWRRRGMAELVRLVPVGVLWSVGVAVLYEVQFAGLARDGYLLRYWAPDFAPFPPQDVSELRWWFDAPFRLFREPGGFQFPGLAGALALFGVVAGVRRRAVATVLLLSPVAVALLASAAHQYPFGRRLALFLMPSLLVLVAHGIEELRGAEWARSPVIALAAGLLVALDPLLSQSLRFLQPKPLEEIRPLLAGLAQEHRPGDLLYVYSDARYAFDWYAPVYGLDRVERRTGRSAEAVWSDDLADLEEIGPRPRVWLLFSHVYGRNDAHTEEDFFVFELERRGRRLAERSAPGASLYLYDLSAPPLAAAPASRP